MYLVLLLFMIKCSDPEQMMMMMQGILPALDPDAMLNLAISMSMQEGVCTLKNVCVCVCVCVRIYTCLCIFAYA